MRLLLVPAALAFAIAGASFAQPAEAAGCIKGAIIGGVAGHLAGHGLLGAGAGCVVGRANANRKIAERDRAYEPDNNYQPPVSNYQRPSPYNGQDPRAYDGNSQGYNQNNNNYYRQ